MQTETLATHIYISAAKRAAEAAGAYFTVLRRGDADRGTILLKIYNLQGMHVLYSQVWNGEKRSFIKMMEAPREADITDACNRELDFDPDMWMIEIEDREGRLFFDQIM